MARHFNKLTDFNEYIELPKPIRHGIDIGKYGLEDMRLFSEPITTNFYRISMKYGFDEAAPLDHNLAEFKSKAVMFFSSPYQFIEWNAKDQWKGFYIHLTREVITKNKHLFYNFMEYGKHEQLYLNNEDEKQLALLFQQLYSVHKNTSFPNELVLSFCQLIFSFIEYFYTQQFKKQNEKSNNLVKQFVETLNLYYKEENQLKLGTPTVQFFADRLFVTPSYLGDVVRTVTGNSPMDHIHQLIISEAKSLLRKNELSNAEIAYQLGFEYPNYFARLFKKYTGLSPTEFKKT